MSTLETAVVFTIILTMLTFFVTAPEKSAMEALSDCRAGFEESEFQNKDLKLYSEKKIGTAVSYDTSPEKLCTYLTGLSDNFRLIYGKAAGLASGVESNEENG
ncbi:MAG: hypothetical protein J5777_06620 [Clostridiales bacterium]|nr:hypothetical protein [Clostridiales bacterium]